MTRGSASAVLLERDDELSVVGDALRRASEGTGGVVVVAGPLGNGKTALLRALPQHPLARHCAVLRASASTIERDQNRGVLRQLIECSAVPAEDDPPADPARLLLDLAASTGGTPLLVLVDDLQWADHESLVTLEALARQVQHLRVVLVVAVRDGDPLAHLPVVVSIVAGAAHRVQPKPLTPAASAALMRDRLGRPCDEEFALVCHELTGGNPMLLVGLALAWCVEGEPPVAANVGLVRALRPSYARDRLVACVRAQTAPARALLEALAVLDGGVADAVALADLDRITQLEVTRSLRRAGLLSATGLAHAGLREAVEATMTAAEHEELQIRAARWWYVNGRPVQDVARLLLGITRPQGLWVVEVLRGAADIALRSGAPEEAARYLRRALLDTSADGTDRAKVLVDLATVVCGFDVQATMRNISHAVALLHEPRDRAAALIRLAPTVLGDAPAELLPMLRQVAAELGDGTGLDSVGFDLALRLEARVRFAGLTDRVELECAVSRLAALGPGAPMVTGAERELRGVLLHFAMLSVGAPAAEIAAQAQRLLGRDPASSPETSSVAPLLVTCLAVADAPGAATDWLDRALEAARSRGDAVEQSVLQSQQALIHLLSGRPAVAARKAVDACELSVLNSAAAGTAAVVVLAGIALQLRDSVLIDQALTFAGKVSANECLAVMVGVLNASRAALRGDLPAAEEALVECGTRLEELGWRNPVLFPWRSLLALVKKRLGDTTGALALAEEERVIAEEWGAPSGIGRAWRVLGALTDEHRGIELSRRAVEVLEGSAHALELALALRQWATLTGRDDLWRRCLEVAVDIGAKNIADQARAALGGGTPTSAASTLTQAELRVALLAVAGRANQEIADELAVTSRAVEKHLTNTYRKLGVRKRVQLSEALHHVGGEQV